MGKVTDVMNARAAECEDMEELIDFCKEFDSEMINFSKFMNELIKRKNMTVKEFVNIYNSQKTKIPKWFDGTLSPTERHQYIKIAILMGMTPEETNHALASVIDRLTRKVNARPSVARDPVASDNLRLAIRSLRRLIQPQETDNTPIDIFIFNE